MIKMDVKRMIILLFVILLGITIVEAAPLDPEKLSYYKYIRQIKPECTNFIGYAGFAVDGDFLMKSNKLSSIAIDSDYFFGPGNDTKVDQWYVKGSNMNNIDALRVLVDGSYDTYSAVQKTPAEFDVDLKNPTLQTFDKIKITLKDSELGRAAFSADGKLLTPVMTKEGFSYVYTFDQKVTTDNLQVKLFFDTILKVAEIELYRTEGSLVFFYVNNECNRMYTVYYGGYGKTDPAYTPEAAQTISGTLLAENINPTYNKDIDKDSVVNENDNCAFVPNADQKDYNNNLMGDACEDFDGDETLNYQDNCIDVMNYDQRDVDADGVGDACDKEDNRFSEQHKWIFYAVAVLALLVFGYMVYRLPKKR